MVDRIAYRPLRDAPRISALISAIGVSFFIENICLVLFTGVRNLCPGLKCSYCNAVWQYKDPSACNICPREFLSAGSGSFVGALQNTARTAMRAISKI
jgi:branched-subunit amino acid ABC-type transport system permease component